MILRELSFDPIEPEDVLPDHPMPTIAAFNHVHSSHSITTH